MNSCLQCCQVFNSRWASSNVVGIICPPDLIRVNCNPQITNGLKPTLPTYQWHYWMLIQDQLSIIQSLEVPILAKTIAGWVLFFVTLQSKGLKINNNALNNVICLCQKNIYFLKNLISHIMKALFGKICHLQKISKTWFKKDMCINAEF